MSGKGDLFHFRPNSNRFWTRSGAVHDERVEWTSSWHDSVTCVVKRGNPPEWRWKLGLCEFQHGKGISESGLNNIGWRGLVPLIEGLCAQIICFRFEIIGGLRSHLLLFFFGRKNVLKKKAVSPRSHPASLHIYTHVYFVHIHKYMYAEIQYIWTLRALRVSHFDSWSHIRVPHLCNVCVQVHIHTHTPTYTPTRAKNREDTDNIPIFSSVKKSPPTPSNKCFHRLAEPLHPHSPMLNETNCTYMRAYAHPVVSVKQMYADVHNICLTYTPAHVWCAQQLWMHAYSPQKSYVDWCMRAYTTMQKLLCHGSYCELILSLARASCRLSFAARPPASSTKLVARRSSLNKSVQIHARSWRGRRYGVAQASFNHLRWCRPHPVCPWFALALCHGGHFIKNSILAIFSCEFQELNIHLHKSL